MDMQDKEEIIVMAVEHFWIRPNIFIRPFCRMMGKPTTKGEMMTMLMNKYDDDCDVVHAISAPEVKE